MKTILVVEDDSYLRELMTFTLTDAGYSVLECSNGAEAVALLAEHYHKIKLIILDLGLPLVKGTQMLRQIKHDPILKRIPVLLCTASELTELNRGINIGVEGYLQKPFSIQNELLLHVQSLLTIC